MSGSRERGGGGADYSEPLCDTSLGAGQRPSCPTRGCLQPRRRGRRLIPRTYGLRFTGWISACSFTHTFTRSSIQQTRTKNRLGPGLEDQWHLPVPQKPSHSASPQAGRGCDGAAHAGGLGPAAGKLLCSDTNPPPLPGKKIKPKSLSQECSRSGLTINAGP